MCVHCAGGHFAAGSDLRHIKKLPENGPHEAGARTGGAYPQNLTKRLQGKQRVETRQYTHKIYWNQEIHKTKIRKTGRRTDTDGAA